MSQYEKLSEENKSKLLDEILTLDFNQIEELYKRINQTVDFANSKIEPIGYTDKSAMSDNELKHYEEIGLKAIKEGKDLQIFSGRTGKCRTSDGISRLRASYLGPPCRG